MKKCNSCDVENPRNLEFGSRILTNSSDVFSQNAWDNMPWTTLEQQSAIQKISKQSTIPMDLQSIIHHSPHEHWDKFYFTNQEKFFKDRQWLNIEFPELFQNYSSPTKVLEIGCGVGNTLFPILRQNNPNIYVYGCDYSSVAINILVSQPEYSLDKCHAFVYDISNPQLPTQIPLGSIDIISCIFVLSALHPDSWKTAIDNIYKLLKPGGLVVFRDYGRYDLAQTRFKNDRKLLDNFYARGDKTRVYFFTSEELASLFKDFSIEQNIVDRRLLVNRAKKLEMYRIWMQGKFRKPMV